MPDFRLDNIENQIDQLATDWSALVISAKSAADPRECADLLDAGIVTLRDEAMAIADSLVTLPTKDIAIDLSS